MRIITEPKLDFSDVLLLPKRSSLQSRKDVDITREFTFKYSPRIVRCTPLVAANMDHTGTLEMAKVFTDHNLLTALHKYYSMDELVKFFSNTIHHHNVFYTLGMRDDDLEKYNAVKSQLKTKFGYEIKLVCIDVPSAYIERFVEFVSKFREDNPDVVLMAGNVVTGEMAEALVLAGADIIKVGIGSGSSCITRRVAGVGVPQLSAVIETADAAHGVSGHVCSDGGIVHPGDIGKAFGGGADFIMLGGALAGHDECSGDVETTGGTFTKKGKKVKKFYGMSSHEAQMAHTGEIKKYRASEGKCVLVPYRGKVEDTLQEMLGGLRSTMTYIGAVKLKEIPKRTTFITVHRQLNTSLGD